MSLLPASLVRGCDSSTLAVTQHLGIHRHREGGLGEEGGDLGGVLARLEALRRAGREMGALGDRGAGLQLEDRAGRLRARLREGRRAQEQELLPQLASVEELRAEGHNTAARVTEVRAAWTVQEAGSVAAVTEGLAWGEVEGRTLGQVVRDVRVAVTKYNQALGNV